MARMARLVVPGLPHHIVQRGNRRQSTFFCDDDRRAYLDYLRLYAKPAGVHFWSYCLMANHVHMVAVPEREDSFSRGFAEAHRRYTRMINFREGWRGYLWEGRFKSCVLSESHLYAAMRYIERNPIRVGIVKNAWDYPWSSAKAHVFNLKDPLLDDNFVVAGIKDWKAFIPAKDEKLTGELLKTHTNNGRPVGDNEFVEMLEGVTGRILHKQKPGPKTQ